MDFDVMPRNSNIENQRKTGEYILEWTAESIGME